MDVAVSVVYVCTHLPGVDRDASSSVSTAVFCTLGRGASIDASPSYARVVRAHAAGELAALTGVGPSRSPWSPRRSCPPRQWCTPRARRSSARYRVASVQRGAVCSTIVGLAASTPGYLSMIVFLEGAPAAVTRSTAVCTWRHQSTCGAVARLTRPGGGGGSSCELGLCPRRCGRAGRGVGLSAPPRCAPPPDLLLWLGYPQPATRGAGATRRGMPHVSPRRSRLGPP